MRVYAAAYYQNRRKMFQVDYKYHLESYHYLVGQKFENLIREDGVRIMLDSGAYSMFTQGIDVDMDAYAQWVKDNADIIEFASNLDVIGAGNEQGSYDNLKYLESLGIEAIPVHHARDEDKWLERYLAEGYKHIALGGLVPETTNYRREWMDHIWGEYLTDKDGYPRDGIRVHGFGMTSVQLMRRYPWFSVDSTAWLMGSMFGKIFLWGRDGKMHTVVFSTEAPQAKKLDAHYDTLAPVVQGEIRELVGELGFEIEDLRQYYHVRDQANLAFYKRLCDVPMQPFIRQQQGLF
jgi:hypothetical protein